MDLSRSDAELVREFTHESGFDTPDHPRPFTTAETLFLVKMLIDETMELLATALPRDQAIEYATACVTGGARDFLNLKGSELAAEQVDALGDMYYYAQNASVKAGMNLSSAFRVIHAANMAKRDPITGNFKRREDGKIIKPPGWTPPDMTKEIERQLEVGSFVTPQ